MEATVPHDVTTAIERAKQELERTIDAISDPLIVIDLDFKIRRANRAAARQAGKDVRGMPGATCHEVLFRLQNVCPSCPIAAGQSGAEGRHGEVTDEGSDRAYQVNVFPMGSEGVCTGFACHYRDVTEERRLASQILQSEKMAGIGQLAGGVAHEINNPLGIIVSFAQLSQQTARTLADEELVDNLDEVIKAAKRCQAIVRSLLDFSRPSKDTDVAPVSMNEVVENALFLVSTQTAMRTVEVHNQLDPALHMVLGNRNQLLQVMVNLVQNALHAMERRGGKLTVRSWAVDSQHVAVAVEDTGCGIEPRNLSRVFEPFFTTKGPGKGTGLGLSVSFGIVQRHEGTIDVESQPGVGTRFTVTLPLTRGQQPA
jgi:two-component system NtrC family sensor kinase